MPDQQIPGQRPSLLGLLYAGLLMQMAFENGGSIGCSFAFMSASQVIVCSGVNKRANTVRQLAKRTLLAFLPDLLSGQALASKGNLTCFADPGSHQCCNHCASNHVRAYLSGLPVSYDSEVDLDILDDCSF